MSAPIARCPRCTVPAAHSDRFCEACGTHLTGPPTQADRMQTTLSGVAGMSDRGHVHARNEDAMALGRRPDHGIPDRIAAVVCDGVSTVWQPDVASRIAAHAALAVLLGHGSADLCTRQAVAAAAAAVADLSPAGMPDSPSCTVAVGIVDPTGSGPRITVGWLGDTRAYWLPVPGGTGRPQLLTTDHSWAAEMIGAGALDEETAHRDARAHAITRWLGADGACEPDVVTLSPTEPGALLLCTDGLWNYLPEPAELAAVTTPALARGGPQAAVEALTAAALDAGGRDNITVVCIAPDHPDHDPGSIP